MRWILVAGGGTGGHVFPGLAVARALGRLADVDVVFAGSPRGLESRVIPEQGYVLELLDVEPMKGGGPQRAIRGALVAAKAMRKAREVVRRLRPAAALSVGGYAAGPAALACVAQRVPLAILEPNSTLGFANRLLAPFSKRAYVAWPETAHYFRADRARLYGVPLRSGFEPRPYTSSADKNGGKRVLILGGSQGARALNEVLPHAVARMLREGRGRLSHVQIIHQSGAGNEDAVRASYEKNGIATALVVPFLDDVPQRMASADLIVARAGAVTVAEISAIGRAAIFIPFPHAADDHQTRNALSLAEIGGAVCLRQESADEVRLASEIGALLEDDGRRLRMADVAREHGRPHAAEDIATDLLDLAGISTRHDVRSNNKNGATNGASSHVRPADVQRKGVS